MTIAQTEFIKGFVLPIVAIVVAYFANPEHLTFLSGGVALVVSGLLGSIEGYIKSETGKALMGAVKVR